MAPHMGPPLERATWRRVGRRQQLFWKSHTIQTCWKKRVIVDTGRRWEEEKIVTKEEEEEGVVKRVTIMESAHIWEYLILTWEGQEVEWMGGKGRDVILVREMLITL